MQSHTIPSSSAALIVRPQISESALRLLDEQAEYWTRQAETYGANNPASEDAVSYGKLADLMSSAARRVRAGESVDVSAVWWADGEPCAATLGSELKAAIRCEFECVPNNVVEPDWRYLSDLAALAADIEAASALEMAAT